MRLFFYLKVIQQLSLKSIGYLMVFFLISCNTNQIEDNPEETLNKIFKLIFIASHKEKECVPAPNKGAQKCHCEYKSQQIELLNLEINIQRRNEDTTIYFTPVFYDKDTCCRYQQSGVKRYGFIETKGFFPLDYADAELPEKYYFKKNNTYFLLNIISLDYYIKSKGQKFFDSINKRHFDNEYEKVYKDAIELFHKIQVIQ